MRLVVPLALLVGAWWLTGHVVRRPAALAGLPGPVGPAGWPKAMLAGVAICALLWLLSVVIDLVRGRHRESAPDSFGTLAGAAAEGQTGNMLAVVGVVVVLAYGFAIPFLGFPLSTALFIIVWCLLGGVRSPVTLLATSLIGTTVLLYLFVLLARMPLDRGHGAIGEATVALYRLLGIY